MAKLKVGFGVLVIAGGAIAFLLQHQAQVRLHEENDSLRQQLEQLQADNGNLSNRLVAVGNSKKPAADLLNELLKLRGEVGGLQQQAGELSKLREEVQRLQAASHNGDLAAAKTLVQLGHPVGQGFGCVFQGRVFFDLATSGLKDHGVFFIVYL